MSLKNLKQFVGPILKWFCWWRICKRSTENKIYCTISSFNRSFNLQRYLLWFCLNVNFATITAFNSRVVIVLTKVQFSVTIYAHFRNAAWYFSYVAFFLVIFYLYKWARAVYKNLYTSLKIICLRWSRLYYQGMRNNEDTLSDNLYINLWVHQLIIQLIV